MEKEIVWVGIRESEILYSDFISDSIEIFGNCEGSLRNKINKNINHNDVKNYGLMNRHYEEECEKCVLQNPNVKFMYYSQIYSYDMMMQSGMLQSGNVVCVNDQNLVLFLNNKFKIRDFLKDKVATLDYWIMRGNEVNFDELKRKLGDFDFVLQVEEGSGGDGTILLNEGNKSSVRIDEKRDYMVTRYCNDNISINIHVAVSDDDILLLPPSMQNIELINNKLIYKGNDFCLYRRIIDEKIDKKFKEQSFVIGKLLQEKGYRGILGIDSIVFDGEVYFVEINPRFQNSSSVLNKALKENGLPSLQEIQYSCFYGGNIGLKPFVVNYSSYVEECDAPNRQIEFEPVEIFDACDMSSIEFENLSYLRTNLYDRPLNIFPYKR